jgi:hypothetical protein
MSRDAMPNADNFANFWSLEGVEVEGDMEQEDTEKTSGILLFATFAS